MLPKPVKAYWVKFIIDESGLTNTDTAITKLVVNSDGAVIRATPGASILMDGACRDLCKLSHGRRGAGTSCRPVSSICAISTRPSFRISLRRFEQFCRPSPQEYQAAEMRGEA